MQGLIHAFDLLDTNEDLESAFVAAVGDEAFLKRLVVARLKSNAALDDRLTVFPGESTGWRDVIDELATRSLFSRRDRVVLIRDADEFVTNHRGQLEDYCRHSGTGQLVLELAKLAANTRLYAAAIEHGTVVECRLPQSVQAKSIDMNRIRQWLQGWAKRQHNLELDARAVESMIDLVGTDLGLIDQELAKLALFVDEATPLTLDLIERVVGTWRQKTTWEMLEAAASGQASEALVQLDRLLQSGEQPAAIFGPMSWSFRRFAAATRIVQGQERLGQRVDLAAAALQAGFRKWPAGAFELALRQLKQLGRDRASKLYGWLLEVDLALKGSHSSTDRSRLALETLIFRMANRSNGA
jgi:DNA polymerase-3 subunit delta